MGRGSGCSLFVLCWTHPGVVRMVDAVRTGCLLFLLLASCAPTREALIRREALSQLETCANWQQWPWKSCIQASVGYCRSQGLEDTCGTDEWYTRPAVWHWRR